MDMNDLSFLRVIPFCFIKYAAATMGQRDMPADQCTGILPLPFLDAIALSMISQADLRDGRRDRVVLERR